MQKSHRSYERALVAAVLVLLPIFLEVPASASPLVQGRMAQRRELQHQVVQVRRAGSNTVRHLVREQARTDRGLKVVSPRSMNHGRWRRVHRALVRRSHHLAAAVRQSQQRIAERVGQLKRQVRSISSWLSVWGVFKTCPVAGPHTVNNDFGMTVRMPGVPVHVHQGNDINASTGTPIVAPFDGRAVASPSGLGGMAVEVFGSAGFVYNAHLSAYGHLGSVNAGEIIGYVGSTGDASGPHDHFEWHPGNGRAVDPYALLSVVC